MSDTSRNEDDDWLEDSDEDDVIDCPECGAEVHAESESCPACGCWITDAEREAGWRDGSASQRVRLVGLWVIGLALIGALLLRWG